MVYIEKVESVFPVLGINVCVHALIVGDQWSALFLSRCYPGEGRENTDIFQMYTLVCCKSDQHCPFIETTDLSPQSWSHSRTRTVLSMRNYFCCVFCTNLLYSDFCLRKLLRFGKWNLKLSECICIADASIYYNIYVTCNSLCQSFCV